MGRATGEVVDGGEIGGRRDEPDEEGTCWKARVTSWRDMREDAIVVVGGGVPPSSDLTSCKVNGMAVKSSAIPSREFTACNPALLEVCDHTAFRCSGSGPRNGESFTEMFKEDLAHEAVW